MEAVSQVVLRNLEYLPVGPIVLLNPAADHLGLELMRSGRAVTASTSSHGTFRLLKNLGIDTEFEPAPLMPEDVGDVLLMLPREKERLSMLLHACASNMATGARLWLIGEIRSGIKSAPRLLQDYFGSVSKRDSARHCVLLEATSPLSTNTFNLDDYEQRWPIPHAKHDFELVSLPGVFSHGRLDNGTRLLLSVLAQLNPGGRILDFGSGSGVIGLSLLAAEPSIELTLLDDSALAIESGKRALELNSWKARSLPSDGLAELDGTYDWIVSNPPFHRGTRNDLEISAEFFRRAGTFLTEKGRILVVFNQHLPYTRWLRDHFNKVETLAQGDGFNVIQASKPK